MGRDDSSEVGIVTERLLRIAKGAGRGTVCF